MSKGSAFRRAFLYKGSKEDGKISDCIESFKNLLSVEYIIVIGRKGVTTILDVLFDKTYCFHLMGCGIFAGLYTGNRE